MENKRKSNEKYYIKAIKEREIKSKMKYTLLFHQATSVKVTSNTGTVFSRI
jgi:hypothetical protein